MLSLVIKTKVSPGLKKCAEIQRFLKKHVNEGVSEEWLHFFKFKFFVLPEIQKTLIFKMLQLKNSVSVTKGREVNPEIYYIICTKEQI